MTFSFRTRPLEWILCALLVFSVLWRGGKSIDATWIAILVVGFVFLCGWLADRFDPAARSQRLQETLSPSWVRITSIGIIVWTILSYVLSQTRNYGLDEVLRTVLYMLTFLWIVRLRERDSAQWMEFNLPRILSLTATGAALVGVFVYLFQPVSRFTGTFFDPRFHTDYWPNAWAEFLLMALPVTLLCILQAQEKRWKWMSAGVLLLTALYLSYSRGGMIAFGGQCAFLLIIGAAQSMQNAALKRQLRINAKKIIGTIVLVFIGAGMVAVVANAIRSTRYDVESISSKVTFTSAEGTSSVNERAQFWGQAIEMIKERPFVGWGPYSFRFVQPSSMTSVLATADHPHNAFLKIAAERGMPTAIFFLILIGGILIAAARRLLFEDATQSFLPVAAFLGVCGVLMHVMIDYNLQFVGIGLPFFILLGWIAPLRPPMDTRRASFMRWKMRRRLGDVVALITLITIIVTIREGWFLVTSSFGRHALAAKDIVNAQQWFSMSHGEMFSRDLLLSEAQLYLEQTETGAALTSLNAYAALNAEDPRVWRLRGEILLASNQFNQAVIALEEAYRRGKYTDIGMLRLLLQAYEAEGNQAYKARKEEFDGLYRAFADAILQNTHFIALSQNVEELQRVSRLLSAIYPSDAKSYASITREALVHAKDERSSYASRAPGLFW